MYSFRQIDLFVNKVYDYHCRISNSQESTLTHGRHPYHRHMCVCLVTELCLTLCDPMDCSPPCSSSVHGILQARILEWVAIPLSRGSSRLRDQTQVSCIEGRFFSHLSHQGNPLHIKPFAFCTAPQSSFLSARLDSA